MVPQDTAPASVLCAHELSLLPITTPAYSSQSNGLPEAFVKTFKRDYVDGAELLDAESRPDSALSLDRGLQHPGAALGTGDAEPGRVPGGGYLKLLAVSSTLGGTPDLHRPAGWLAAQGVARDLE